MGGEMEWLQLHVLFYDYSNLSNDPIICHFIKVRSFNLRQKEGCYFKDLIPSFAVITLFNSASNSFAFSGILAIKFFDSSISLERS